MKKRKLVLSKETIRPLDARRLGGVAGGLLYYEPTHVTCAPPVRTVGPASMPALCGGSVACNGGGPSGMSGDGP